MIMKEIDPANVPKVRLDDIEEKIVEYSYAVKGESIVNADLALHCVREAKLRTFEYLLEYVDMTPAFKTESRYKGIKSSSTAIEYKNTLRTAIKQMIDDHRLDNSK